MFLCVRHVKYKHIQLQAMKQRMLWHVINHFVIIFSTKTGIYFQMFLLLLC